VNKLPSELNPFFEQAQIEKPRMWLVDILQSVVIAMFICIIIYLFIATPNQVRGPSMRETFQSGDLVLTNKLSQWLGETDIGKQLGLNYQRGDVVVFQKPNHDDLIKRIVGLPGETVMILNGDVYVNGKKIREDYLPPALRTVSGSFAGEGQLVTLKSDEFFVMGDNRGNSIDSRFAEYGPIKRDWLKGKVIVRYWPLYSLGTIGTGKIEFLDN
jgi:signal peptidase I